MIITRYLISSLSYHPLGSLCLIRSYPYPEASWLHVSFVPDTTTGEIWIISALHMTPSNDKCRRQVTSTFHGSFQQDPVGIKTSFRYPGLKVRRPSPPGPKPPGPVDSDRSQGADEWLHKMQTSQEDRMFLLLGMSRDNPRVGAVTPIYLNFSITQCIRIRSNEFFWGDGK